MTNMVVERSVGHRLSLKGFSGHRNCKCWHM